MGNAKSKSQWANGLPRKDQDIVIEILSKELALVEEKLDGRWKFDSKVTVVRVAIKAAIEELENRRELGEGWDL